MKERITRVDNSPVTESTNSDPINVITEALRGLRFGTVKLIVQDGVLVRLERTENRQVTRRLTQDY